VAVVLVFVAVAVVTIVVTAVLASVCEVLDTVVLVSWTRTCESGCDGAVVAGERNYF
jgi:uncharacterized protein YoxC